MKEKLYVLQYGPDGVGCPHHLSGENVPPEWEWNNDEPLPFELKIEKNYAFIIQKSDVVTMDFDFYGTKSKFVSENFIALCNDHKVNFRAVPLDIRTSRGMRPAKSYFVFLPADHLSILDEYKSIAQVEHVDNSGQVMMDRLFPSVPIYAKIEKFVLKDIEVPALFQCIEIFSLVCTESFRDESIRRNLRGLNFIPLDESYIYDPWAGW